MDANYIINDDLPEIAPQKSNGQSQSTIVSVQAQYDNHQPDPPIHQTTKYQPFSKKLSSVVFADFYLRSFTTVNLVIVWAIYITIEIISTATQNTYECLAYDFGAMYPPEVNGANFQYYRYITSMFLTSGLGMILVYTIFLVICSYPLEKELGRWKFMFFYFMSGFGGNIIQQYSSSHAITSAVTQCIFGLAPLIIVFIITKKEVKWLRKSLMLAALLLIQYCYSEQALSKRSINEEQLSKYGFATGILLTIILWKSKSQNCCCCSWENFQAGVKVLLLFTLVAFFICNQITIRKFPGETLCLQI